MEKMSTRIFCWALTGKLTEWGATKGPITRTGDQLQASIPDLDLFPFRVAYSTPPPIESSVELLGHQGREVFEIASDLVTHDVDLEVIIGYFFIPDGPFCLDRLALGSMDIERRFRQRVDLLDQTRWQNDHGPSVDARQYESTVCAGELAAYG